MTTTPSGWYDDGHGAMRWWDGAQWTEHVTEPAADVSGVATPSPGESIAAQEAGTGPLPGAVGPVLVAPGHDPAPTEPTKSKLWIVWVVLGVVVLGVVIAAVVFIPPLVAGALGGGGQSGGSTDDDQQAAVAAVGLYDEAWQNADCDAYVASTSEGFRTQSGLTDCSAFESEAEAFFAASEDYEVTVTDVREENGAILVATTETYTSLVGEDGAPLEEPTEESIDWVYVVVSDGDDWVIDEMK